MLTQYHSVDSPHMQLMRMLEKQGKGVVGAKKEAYLQRLTWTKKELTIKFIL